MFSINIFSISIFSKKSGGGGQMPELTFHPLPAPLVGVWCKIQLTPNSWVLPEKPIVSQLIKIFPVFHGTLRFARPFHYPQPPISSPLKIYDFYFIQMSSETGILSFASWRTGGKQTMEQRDSRSHCLPSHVAQRHFCQSVSQTRSSGICWCCNFTGQTYKHMTENWDSSKEAGLEVNADRTVLMSRHKNKPQNIRQCNLDNLN
jgi:hypothetical protein